MKNWKKYKLGEILTFGNGKIKPKEEGSIPIYGGNGILGYGNDSNYNGKTIVIGRVGAYCGSVFYENKPIWVSDNALAAKPKGGNNTKFLYYFLKFAELNKWAGGSSHPLITQSLLNSLEFNICDNPTTQTQIAQILTSFDDKIELLGQMNQTLETMAQTFFKEWFVDFNFPGFDGELVDELPKGWKKGKLREFFDFVKGVSYKSSELEESSKALVTLKSINRFGGFNFNGFKEFTGKYKVTQELDNGDVVIAQTDITQAADVIGCPAIIENPFKYEKLIASLDLVKCIQKTDYFSKLVLFYFLNQKNFKDFCLSHTNGSTVLHLRSSEIPNYEFVLPDKFTIMKFDKIISIIRDKIILNNNQILNLIQLRDTLLPKLMSGAVEI